MFLMGGVDTLMPTMWKCNQNIKQYTYEKDMQQGLKYLFPQLLHYIQVANWSTSTDMTVEFYAK